MSKKTQKALKKNPRLLSPEEKQAALKELLEAKAHLDEIERQAKDANPFWYYSPVVGQIPDERRAFLAEFLKPEDIPQQLHGALNVHLSHASIRGASGGNQCLGAETEIYDPVRRVSQRVEDIKGDFHVYAWDGNGFVVARATKPFVKEVDDIYEIRLADGNTFTASLSHLVLTPEGFRAISDVHPSSGVFLPPSIWEHAPAIHGEDDLRFFETIQDSQCDCLHCSHLYGGQPRLVEDNDLNAFPSLSDAPKHRVQNVLQKGGRACKSFDIPADLYEHLRANQDGQDLNEVQFVDTLFGDAYKPYKLTSDSRLVVPQSKPASYLPQPKRVSARLANLFSVLPYVPSLAVTNVAYLRRDVKYDLTVPGYHNYWASGVIHHNSSKTTLSTIEALIKATTALPLCFEPGKGQYEYPKERLMRNGPQHVRVIGEDYQNGVLRNLIPTYRKWTPKEYLPNGRWEEAYSAGEQVLRLRDPETKQLCGTIEFMSNKQDLGTFQGPPRHMMVFDEEPQHEVYKENLMRFTTAQSLDVLFAMTPTKGLSWTYDLFTRGTDESGNNVEWFQISSVCNPHANLKVLREILREMESYDEIKMRLLGEFISLSGLVYGKLFQHSLHVIPPFESGCNCGAAFKKHKEACPYNIFQHYLGIDPHMVKDSTAADCFIDRDGNFYVDTCYKRPVSVEEFKRDLALLMSGKRLAKSIFDPSSDSSITIHNGLNIFKLCTSGKNAVPKAIKADKYQGSIAAGVASIKERLKVHPISKKPRFFIFDRPENRELIKSFKTMQRDTWANEEQKGQKDKILEGVHDHHACVRYINQLKLSWRPTEDQMMEMPIPDMEAILV